MAVVFVCAGCGLLKKSCKPSPKTCSATCRSAVAVRKLQEIIGRDFGDWRAESVDVRESGPSLVFCKCNKCGRSRSVAPYSLVSGKSRGCGCAKKDINRSRSIPMIGRRFGRLTVIESAPTKYSKLGKAILMWVCRCDDGNIVTVNGKSLRNGNTKSCGCIKAEKTIERNTELAALANQLRSQIAGDWEQL